MNSMSFLRKEFDVSFVGTEPAVETAVADSKKKDNRSFGDQSYFEQLGF